MRSRTRHSLSTLVFLVPLLGVPLMAIFGIPQFVPVIASSVSEESTPYRLPKRGRGVGESAAPLLSVSAGTSLDSEFGNDEPLRDVFRPSSSSRRDRRSLANDDRRSETSFVQTSWNVGSSMASQTPVAVTNDTSAALRELFGDSDARKREPRLEDRRSELAASGPRSPGRFDPALREAREHSDEGLTWRAAVQRLNALGIRKFRLEPGRQLGEFYFACEFASEHDARITRRFEAEASEPLLAVNTVLRQIDECLSHRSAR